MSSTCCSANNRAVARDSAASLYVDDASPWAALLLIVPQFRIRIQTLTMKLSAIVALLAVSGASAYSTPSRNDLRSLGQKSFSTSSGPRKVEASMKMEGV